MISIQSALRLSVLQQLLHHIRETIRVSTMEIAQYAIPWIAVGIPILQIPLRYSRGIFAKSFSSF